MKGLSVLRGSDPLIAFKQLHKIFLIRETAHIRNPVNRQGTVGEQVFCHGDPCTVHICENGISGVFLKNIGQISGMIPKLFRNGSHAERLVVMGTDPFYDIQNMDGNAGIQKTVDLERFICGFHEEQVQSIVAPPCGHIIFPFGNIKKLHEEKP